MRTVASCFYGAAFGSLAASCFIADWKVPSRPYHAALAILLLVGFVLDVVGGM